MKSPLNQRLCDKKNRFIKIKAKEKIPLEKNWTTENNYSFDNQNLLDWVSQGGNVGLLTGYNDLLVIDFDDLNFQNKYLPQLPKTLMQKSGSGGLHLIYKTDTPESFKILDDEKNTLADIQGQGKQIIISPSVHPNGKQYAFINDLDINFIPIAELKALFSDYLKTKKIQKKNSLVKPDLVTILKRYNVDTSKNPTQCPWHDSKGGKCFSYRENEQYFNCFHCGKGGDVINFVMEAEKCDFKKACEILQIKPNQPNLPNKPNLSEKEKALEIEKLLLRERPKVSQMKFGIHKEVFYFGTSLFDEKKKIPAIITSERKLYFKRKKNEDYIRDDFDLYYRYDFEHDILDNHISVEAIRTFVKNEEEDLTFQDIFEQIVSLNKKYMYYVDEESHYLVALNIMASYFLPCFSAIGRLFLEAEKGSGKTRQCTIMKLLCCNSIMSADITKSSFFRVMESTCGTLIIDDFDSLSEEEKTSVLQHYKTGYKAGSKSIRTGDQGARSQDAFRNYGHVIMNNTEGLDDISKDRSKFLPIIKHSGKVTVSELDEKSKVWQDLTDKLTILALLNWRKVKDTYSTLKTKFNARRNEITKAELTLAHLINDEVYSKVEGFFEQTLEKRDYKDLEGDWEFNAIQIMLEAKQKKFQLKHDIASKVAQKLYGNKTNFDSNENVDNQAHKISVRLGKIFNNYPFLEHTKPKNVSHYRIKDETQFLSFLEARGWLGMLGGLGWLGQLKVLKYYFSEKKVMSENDIIQKFDEGFFNKLRTEGYIRHTKGGFALNYET